MPPPPMHITSKIRTVALFLIPNIHEIASYVQGRSYSTEEQTSRHILQTFVVSFLAYIPYFEEIK
jgi:hypothetical protein